MQGNNPLSLSALQQMVGDSLRMNPSLSDVWVVAELSDVRVSGGHCYMELIEKDDTTGKVSAKLRATIWSSRYRILERLFLGATGSVIRSGLKVLIRGTVSHHIIYGLSFSISDIDPSYTLGDIERQRREILERLRKEGVIDQNRSLEFPEVPRRIAVISAAGAAGYGDFMSHLTSSPEGFIFYTLLIPAVMQGEHTAESVLSALDFVESTIDVWDSVVIIRGGGSTTDMHGFDDYGLAKRVAEFPLPVVVGIGHERDRNVLDEIACIRCKTPTAVADFLVECCRKAWNELKDAVSTITGYVSDNLQGEFRRIANIESLLPAKVSLVVMNGEKRIEGMRTRIEYICSRKLSGAFNQFDFIRLQMERGLRRFVERPALKLKRIEDMLRVLSPENTLKRGYSITRINGVAILNPSGLKAGDMIETQLYQGTFRSEFRNGSQSDHPVS